MAIVFEKDRKKNKPREESFRHELFFGTSYKKPTGIDMVDFLSEIPSDHPVSVKPAITRVAMERGPVEPKSDDVFKELDLIERYSYYTDVDPGFTSYKSDVVEPMKLKEIEKIELKEVEKMDTPAFGKLSDDPKLDVSVFEEFAAIEEGSTSEDEMSDAEFNEMMEYAFKGAQFGTKIASIWSDYEYEKLVNESEAEIYDHESRVLDLAKSDAEQRGIQKKQARLEKRAALKAERTVSYAGQRVLLGLGTPVRIDESDDEMTARELASIDASTLREVQYFERQQLGLKHKGEMKRLSTKFARQSAMIKTGLQALQLGVSAFSAPSGGSGGSSGGDSGGGGGNFRPKALDIIG
jgi:hypothetical protein